MSTNEYLNRYTDSTILWLTWGTKNGMRVSQNPVNTPTSDTLKTYTAFIHLEHQGPYPGLQKSATDDYSSQDYRWNPFDLWPWDFLNGSGTATVIFLQAMLSPIRTVLRSTLNLQAGEPM